MKRIIPYIEKLEIIDLPSLERKGKDYEFTLVYTMLEKMYVYYTKLKNESNFFDPLPEHNIDQIIQSLNEFSQITEEINSFDPQKPEALARQNDLFSRTKNCYRNSYNFIRDFKIYLLEKSIQNLGSTEFVEESKKLLNKIVEDGNQVKETLKDSEETLKIIKELKGKEGVKKYSGIFKKQAEENRKEGNRWLLISVIGVIAFLITLGIFYYQLYSGIKGGSSFETLLQVLFAKLILLSFASIVLFQVIKNYNANMHMYSLNKHRENSLDTFDAFYDVGKDDKTKDKILIQATKAIFEPGDTGYISKKDKSNYLEFVTNFLDKNKG